MESAEINSCPNCEVKFKNRKHNRGDLFLIGNEEYMLRYINNTCWLEPVVAKYGNNVATGGLNEVYHIDELDNLKKINW